MLESILAGLLFYYVSVFIIGLFATFAAIQTSIIIFAVIVFAAMILVARYSKTMSRICGIITAFCVLILAAADLIIPAISRSFIIGVSVLFAVIVYLAIRRLTFKRFLKKNDEGNRIAPPFGKEWLRWLLIFTV